VVKFNETNHYGRLSGRNIEDMLPILVILMDNLTKETRKTLPYGKQSHAYYALALPLDDGFSRLAFRMYSNEYKIFCNHFDIHGGGMDKIPASRMNCNKVANWTNTSQLLMQNIDIERQEKWLIC
jgi:cysteinyl-tRNA synthetase